MSKHACQFFSKLLVIICFGFFYRFRLTLADDFLDTPQDRVAIYHRRPWVLDDPLLADHSLRIDEKERPIRGHRLFVEYTVTTDDLSLRVVAEQRVRQLKRVGERLLRKGRIGADREILDTQGFEALEVSLPGRQVCCSGRSKIRSVELDQHPFLAPEVTEGNVDPVGARQLEVRRPVTHLERRGHSGYSQ